MTDSSNQQLLAQIGDAWARARKTQPLWAKVATEAGTLQSLEGPVSYEAGDYICRGVNDDFWVQDESKVLEKYDSTPKTAGRALFPKPKATKSSSRRSTTASRSTMRAAS
ncbi:MAG: hypothetical protein CMJ78_24860 [Planctomycetaceae bacterium]|nr:hypothetical protein [Planctomycetaceae bacterium]